MSDVHNICPTTSEQNNDDDDDDDDDDNEGDGDDNNDNKPMVGDLFVVASGHRETTALKLIVTYVAEIQN